METFSYIRPHLRMPLRASVMLIVLGVFCAPVSGIGTVFAVMLAVGVELMRTAVRLHRFENNENKR